MCVCVCVCVQLLYPTSGNLGSPSKASFYFLSLSSVNKIGSHKPTKKNLKVMVKNTIKEL